MRRYHADVEVTLRYHDAVYEHNPVAAKEALRRTVERLFEDLDPLIMDVSILNLRQVPESEDIDASV